MALHSSQTRLVSEKALCSAFKARCVLAELIAGLVWRITSDNQASVFAASPAWAQQTGPV
jgi:hypothetical protein